MQLLLRKRRSIKKRRKKNSNVQGWHVGAIHKDQWELGARILDAHLDDEVVPYYMIKLEDGREKQTDNVHLSLLEQ